MDQIDCSNSVPRPFYVRLKNSLLMLYVFFSACTGFFLMFFPFLPTILLSPVFFKNIADFLIRSWFEMFMMILEKFVGTKFNIYMDDELAESTMKKGKIVEEYTKSSLLISNHCSCLDWIYVAKVMGDFFAISKFKVVLKSVLKHVIGAGWAMQIGLFLFLNRNWEKDMHHVNGYLDHFKRYKFKLQLLLFPEGTYINKQAKNNSDKFAKKMGLPIYKNVLHPRTRGFIHILKNYSNFSNKNSSCSEMSTPDCTVDKRSNKDKNLDNSIGDFYFNSVIDFTLAFPGFGCFEEVDVLTGRMPTRIDVAVKKYDISELESKSEEEISDWLLKLWKQKEDSLEHFSKHHRFADNLNLKLIDPNTSNRASYTTSLIFFSMANIVIIYLTLKYLLFKVYLLSVTILFISLSYTQKTVDRNIYKY